MEQESAQQQMLKSDEGQQHLASQLLQNQDVGEEQKDSDQTQNQLDPPTQQQKFKVDLKETQSKGDNQPAASDSDSSTRRFNKDDDDSNSEESKVFKKRKELQPKKAQKLESQNVRDGEGSSSPVSSTSSDQNGKNSCQDSEEEVDRLTNGQEAPNSPCSVTTPTMGNRPQHIQIENNEKNHIVMNQEPPTSEPQKDTVEMNAQQNVWQSPIVRNFFQNANSEEQKEPQQEQLQQHHSSHHQDEVDEDDIIYEDEQQVSSQTNFVVETSPKGRFKRFSEELGRGAYKIVYKGVDNETGCEIAWNVINLNRLQTKERQRIKSEIDLIKKLQHKNIIHFITAWYNKEKEQVAIITEMITGGSLRKYVEKIKIPRLKVIKGWCKEILQGLVYLHEQKPHPIIHRDLKCDNILINSYNGEIRIGDLGLSTPMQHSYTSSVLGTPEFMAPELYEECYDTGVDIYAFGMCVLEMITLERPYMECQNPAQIYNKVINGVYPKALDTIMDEEVCEFIKQCLVKAEKRPSAQKLLESAFINETDDEKNNHEVKVFKSHIITKKLTSQNIRQAFDSAIPEQEDEDESEEHKTMQGEAGYTQAAPQDNQGISIEHQTQDESEDLLKSNNDEDLQRDDNVTSNMHHQNDQEEIKLNHIQKSNYQQNDTHDEVKVNAQSQRVSSNQLDGTLSQDKSSSGNHQLFSKEEIASKAASRSRESERARKREKQRKLNEQVEFLNMMDEEKQKKLEQKQASQSLEKEIKQSYIPASNGENPGIHNNGEINQSKNERVVKGDGGMCNDKEKGEEKNSVNCENCGKETNETKKVSSLSISKSQPQEAKDPSIAAIIPIAKVPSTPQSSTKATNLNEESSSSQNFPEKKNKIEINVKKQYEEDKHGYQPQQNQYSPQQQNSVQGESDKKNFVLIPLQTKQTFQHAMNFQNSNVQDEFRRVNTAPQKLLAGFDTSMKSSNQKTSPSQYDKQKSLLAQSKLNQQQEETQKQHVHKMIQDYQVTPNSEEFDSQTSSSVSCNSTSRKLKRNKSFEKQGDQENIKDKPLSSDDQSEDQKKEQKSIDSSKDRTKELHKFKNYVNDQRSESTKSQLTPSNIGNNAHAIQKQPIVLKNQTFQNQTSHQEKNDAIRHSTAPLLLPAIQKQESIMEQPKSINPSKELINMTFKIGKHQDVTFDFDINHDTPESVAREMVNELGLDDNQMILIVKQIESQIIKNKAQQQNAQLTIIKQKSQQWNPQDYNPLTLHNQAIQLATQQIEQQQHKCVALPDQQQQQKNGINLTEQPSQNTPINRELVRTEFGNMFKIIEEFYSKMKEMKFENTDMIADSIEMSPEENVAHRRFLANVLACKRTFKKELEIARENKSKKKQMVTRHYQVSPGQEQQIMQTQSAQNSRVVPSCLTYHIPSSLRQYFNTLPQQLYCVQKFTKVLKKRDYPDNQKSDEEVVMLQNVLNLLFSYSQLKLFRTRGKSEQEFQQMVQTHIPLKVDGIFGEITEVYVQNFQKYKKVKPEDGSVTEKVWLLMLQDVEAISNRQMEEIKKVKSVAAINSNNQGNSYQLQQLELQTQQMFQSSINQEQIMLQKQINENYKPNSPPSKNQKITTEPAINNKNVFDKLAKNQGNNDELQIITASQFQSQANDSIVVMGPSTTTNLNKQIIPQQQQLNSQQSQQQRQQEQQQVNTQQRIQITSPDFNDKLNQGGDTNFTTS